MSTRYFDKQGHGRDDPHGGSDIRHSDGDSGYADHSQGRHGTATNDSGDAERGSSGPYRSSQAQDRSYREQGWGDNRGWNAEYERRENGGRFSASPDWRSGAADPSITQPDDVYPQYGMRRSSGAGGSDEGSFSGSRHPSRANSAYGPGQDAPGRQYSQHDQDYHQWRQEQIANLDSDYEAWRGERYQTFSDDFNRWRGSRNRSTTTTTNATAVSDNKSKPSQ